jgi:hypothetical protein
MPDLVEPIRQVIDGHRETGSGDESGVACSCGAKGLSDHPRHVAQQVVERLGLRPERIDDAKKHIRYATAWLDWELTKLEGAEC